MAKIEDFMTEVKFILQTRETMSEKVNVRTKQTLIDRKQSGQQE